VWQRATRSLWCATLFRDIHTAVDAGNVLLRENFMGGSEKNYVRQCFCGEAYALGGGQTGNFRGKKNNLFWELDTKNAGMPAF
jgi:hypothetical protein